MAHVTLEAPDLKFDEPMLIDGLPGQGLTGKLIADYVVTELDMEYYAGVYCEGVPSVAAYRMDNSAVRPPVQIYASAEQDLLALVSDIPVSPSDAREFASCLMEWLSEHTVTPIFLSGLRETPETEDDRSPELYGLSTGEGDTLLEKTELVPPRHAGIITGPTGALFNRASDIGLDSVGLLFESNDEIPDYEAARIVVDQGIEPITRIEIDTTPFVDRSIEMSHVAESVIEQMSGRSEGSTRAQPTPTFE